MIELATIEDLKEIIKIMQLIKEEMREENNPQWGSTEEDYPSYPYHRCDRSGNP